jgi:hypothetical protein
MNNMGMLDFLIDKDNRTPKIGLEYIYRHDMVWKPNDLTGYPIKVGTIVTNVIQISNRGYEFNIKGDTETLRTNYAWALAENTPDNLARIEEYDKEYLKFKEYESFVDSLRNNIVTLKSKILKTW